MAKKPNAHEELDRLRGLAGNERVRLRDLQHRGEVAHETAAQAEQAIAQGYDDEDERAIEIARGSLRDAEVEADDVAHRIAAAEARLLTAQAIVDRYVEEHSADLIAEAVGQAEQVTQQISTTVAEVLRLHRLLIASRTEQDHLIAASGGEPRLDGPEASHAWERALLDLERVVKASPSLDAPRPRWHGRQAAHERDRVALALQEQRRRASPSSREGVVRQSPCFSSGHGKAPHRGKPCPLRCHLAQRRAGHPHHVARG